VQVQSCARAPDIAADTDGGFGIERYDKLKRMMLRIEMMRWIEVMRPVIVVRASWSSGMKALCNHDHLLVA
jgi:hypothetical protein